MAGAMVLFVALVMGKEYLDTRKFHNRCLDHVFDSYGKPAQRSYKAGELEHIEMYYRKHPCKNQLDDITWNDLDMDEIYQKINVSCSAAGDEYLYYRLRTPMYDHKEMERFERQIRYFMDNQKKREEVVRGLYTLGRSGRHSIYEYLDKLDLLGERKNFRYIMYDVLLFASVGVMFLSLPTGIILFLIMACHNMIGYFKEYKPVEPYVTSFYYIRRMLKCAEKTGKAALSEFTEEQAGLKECLGRLRGFMRDSYLVITSEQGTGNPLEVVIDYLKMLFYLDLIQFNRALGSLRSHMKEVDEMVTLLGQIETAIVIGSYRNSLQGAYCVPAFTRTEDLSRKDDDRDKSTGIRLVIEDVYHPLLENPVVNSIAADKGILLTGSNASGKSTFLRAAALCAVFAQTIHTCPASRYEAPVFRIYSSMSLKDNILSGESYYMAEIKSIKRILDQVNAAEAEKCNILCFVDEVLRGTNTVERIAASTQVLKMLSGKNVLCFAATHDVELTRLLDGQYENYHFEEKLEEDDIFFPYQLLAGPAVTRNAIALLKILGYDDRIIADAESMAKAFLKTGVWE